MKVFEQPNLGLLVPESTKKYIFQTIETANDVIETLIKRICTLEEKDTEFNELVERVSALEEKVEELEGES